MKNAVDLDFFLDHFCKFRLQNVDNRRSLKRIYISDLYMEHLYSYLLCTEAGKGRALRFRCRGFNRRLQPNRFPLVLLFLS